MFVGLCSYYRRFVRNFAKHAAPLNRLMGKYVAFEWTVDCETSFTYLKDMLSSAPIVALPDFSVPFKVFTDASKEAVGAVLAQVKEGVEHVVAYASQTLNQTQRRWSTFDRELWAVVWAVREFRHYIGLTSFTIVTDHRPLLSLQRMTLDHDPTGRRGRWILELDPLNWDIVYKDGQRHMNADALSRRPDRDYLADSRLSPLDTMVGVNAVHPTPPDPQPSLLTLGHDLADIRAQQEADADLQVVLGWLEASRRPSRAQL